MLLAIALPLAALGLTGLVIAAAVKELRERRRPAEHAHACPVGAFNAIATFDVLYEDTDDTVAAFDGLHCDRCGARLACRACDATPRIGDVISLKPGFDSERYRCCQSPDYDLAPAETPEEWKGLN